MLSLYYYITIITIILFTLHDNIITARIFFLKNIFKVKVKIVVFTPLVSNMFLKLDTSSAADYG